jgi:hypothetical protein
MVSCRPGFEEEARGIGLPRFVSRQARVGVSGPTRAGMVVLTVPSGCASIDRPYAGIDGTGRAYVGRVWAHQEYPMQLKPGPFPENYRGNRFDARDHP